MIVTKNTRGMKMNKHLLYSADLFLNAELAVAGIVLVGPHAVNAKRDAALAKRVGGRSGLKNFVSDLISFWKKKETV